jgi:hypothetical protein
MSKLSLKPAENCRYDIISLGEIMLRLDPGDGRIHTAREFKAWEATAPALTVKKENTNDSLSGKTVQTIKALSQIKIVPFWLGNRG